MMVIARYPVEHSLKEAIMEYEAITEKIIVATQKDVGRLVKCYEMRTK
jgi:hypothetical protein